MNTDSLSYRECLLALRELEATWDKKERWSDTEKETYAALCITLKERSWARESAPAE